MTNGTATVPNREQQIDDKSHTFHAIIVVRMSFMSRTHNTNTGQLLENC